jgi:hypothetical protein
VYLGAYMGCTKYFILPFILFLSAACDEAFKARPDTSLFDLSSLAAKGVVVKEGRDNMLTMDLDYIPQVQFEVNWRILDESGNEPSGLFNPTNGTTNVTPGMVTLAIPINIAGDNIYKGNQTFYLNISKKDSPDEKIPFTLEDSKLPPLISFAPAQATEGKDLIFKYTISEAPYKPSKFSYTTVDGTAKAQKDFTAVQGIIEIPAGQTEGQIVVKTIDDLTYENEKELTINLTNAVFSALQANSVSGKIVSDDAVPSINITEPNTAEGSDAVIVLTLSNPSDLPISISYATADGTAKSGADYTANSGTVAFGANEVAKNITIKTLDDALDENEEIFSVNLSNPINVNTPVKATVKILQNDVDQGPMATIANALFLENINNATIPIVLSKVSGRDQVFAVTITADTATAGDYQLTTASVTIPAGSTSGNINIRIIDDSNYEPTEKFSVNITSATAGIAVGQATIQIQDNDPVPTLQISSVNGTENGPTTIRASLSGASYQNITFSVSTADGTARAGADYVAVANMPVTIPAGQFGINFQINSVNNTVHEIAETYKVNVSNVVGATLAANSVSVPVTIYDDEFIYQIVTVLTPNGRNCASFVGCYYDVNYAISVASEYNVQYSWNINLSGGSFYQQYSNAPPSGSAAFPPGVTNITHTYDIACYAGQTCSWGPTMSLIGYY